MNTFATVELAITPEEIASLPAMDMIRSPRDSGTRTPSLSSKREAFLRDRFSTKLEDPHTGRWIRSWREKG